MDRLRNTSPAQRKMASWLMRGGRRETEVIFQSILMGAIADDFTVTDLASTLSDKACRRFRRSAPTNSLIR